MATPTIDELWDFYANNYGGNLPEEAFLQLANSVQMRIDELIFSREVPETMEQRYMQTFCELVDFKNQTNAALLQSGAIQSENIDGYSVSYRDQARQMLLSEELRIAGQYLTYPKNLMYCGAELKCRPTET